MVIHAKKPLFWMSSWHFINEGAMWIHLDKWILKVYKNELKNNDSEDETHCYTTWNSFLFFQVFFNIEYAIQNNLEIHTLVSLIAENLQLLFLRKKSLPVWAYQAFCSYFFEKKTFSLTLFGYFSAYWCSIYMLFFIIFLILRTY